MKNKFLLILFLLTMINIKCAQKNENVHNKTQSSCVQYFKKTIDELYDKIDLNSNDIKVIRENFIRDLITALYWLNLDLTIEELNEIVKYALGLINELHDLYTEITTPPSKEAVNEAAMSMILLSRKKP